MSDLSFYSRLFIKPDVDSRLRVRKQDVQYNLYRTFRKFVKWTPFLSKNICVFGGIDEKANFLKRMALQTKKFSKNVELYLFDRSQELSRISEELKDFTYFKNPVYSESLDSLLTDLIALRDKIRENNERYRTAEAFGRKVTLIMINLSREESIEINRSSVLSEKLLELLVDSYNERMYITLLTEVAQDLPLEIHGVLDWAVYLGKNNQEFCQSIHSDMENSYYSVRQVIIGCLFDYQNKRLVVLHDLNFHPSEWYKSKKKALDSEDEAYKKLLDSLDDGSGDTHEI